MGKQEDIKLLQQVEEALVSAKANHTKLMGHVERWRNDIEENQAASGKLDDLKFSYTPKDLQNICDVAQVQIVKHFVQNPNLISVKPSKVEGLSEVVSKLLNEQWNDNINSFELMNNVVSSMLRDGTSIVKVGWNANANSPDVEVVPIDEVFVDASARVDEDVKFVIQAKRVTVNDILTNESWFGKHKKEELLSLAGDNNEDRYTREDDFGVDSYAERSAELLQEMNLYEFYGVLEVGNEVKNMVIIFQDGVIINSFESPYPSDWVHPFVLFTYNRKPFTIFGESLAENAAQQMKFRTGIYREILANTEKSNSGVTFAKKGALDYVNRRKLDDGSASIIETNLDPANIQFQTIAPIPASTFQLLDTLKSDVEETIGISSSLMAPSGNTRMLNSGTSATAASITQSNAESRSLHISRGIANSLQQVIEKFLDLDIMMLMDYELDVNGQKLLINGDMLERLKIDVEVQTSGTLAEQQNNLSMMLQLVQSNFQVIPNAAEIVQNILTKMANNMNLNGIAQSIKQGSMNNQEQQMLMQQQQQQIQELQLELEMQKAQSEIAVNHAKAALDSSKAQEAQVDTQLKALGA